MKKCIKSIPNSIVGLGTRYKSYEPREAWDCVRLETIREFLGIPPPLWSPEAANILGNTTWTLFGPPLVVLLLATRGGGTRKSPDQTHRLLG